jgi:uridylate kinase
MSHKVIVLKLTGEIIQHGPHGLDASGLEHLAKQVKALIPSIKLGIVMGGGNFFRGAQEGMQMHLKSHVGHTVGMLATMMNGLIIQDIFESSQIKTALFSALECNGVGSALSPQNIASALEDKDCLIFSGGTGNPYFTTDTTAVIRALQINATQLWKGTKVDGVYTSDPTKNPDAQFLKKLTYKEVLDKKLGVMDGSAFALAQQHNLTIKIFNIFHENSLIEAASQHDYGSTISA